MKIDKLNDLIYKFGLFVDSDETIYSKRVLQEVQDFEANGKRMAEIGRKGGQASAKAKAQADAQANGQACAEPYAKADAQQKKENKKNKEKKENKINAPDGVSALTGKLPDGYSVHPNSGEVYTVIDGKMYNINGDELNSAGFVVIDFGLSKHNL